MIKKNNLVKIRYNDRRLETLRLPVDEHNDALKSMKARMGGVGYHPVFRINDTLEGTEDMSKRLIQTGGFPQQDRMIRDKYHSFDMATKYSYQGARLRRWYSRYVDVMDGELDEIPIPALMNPNKLKQDYDDKIVSVSYEYMFAPGDIFEWCNTHTYWLIYLQDLEELAYFRGNVRRCTFEITWEDEDGNRHSTYAAVRGPVETKIDYIQKHKISVDNPNLSLNILMPLTPDTAKYFKRYSKFYLRELIEGETDICWRVEAIDTISTPGILEIAATEYYANKFEDNMEEGIVGDLIPDPEEPNPEVAKGELEIKGETHIKPKMEYEFYVDTMVPGEWKILESIVPVGMKPEGSVVHLRWGSPYSGRFTLRYQISEERYYDKIIIVDSLF